MDILYCGDRNIRDGVLVSVLSLLAHADKGEPLSVHVATADFEAPGVRGCLPVDRRFVQGLDALVRGERPGSSAALVDASRAFSSQPPAANLGTRFTPLCMLRLYADLLPELDGCERLLYLDNDVLCRGDPSELYGADLGGAEVGGVLDRYGSWFFHRGPQARDYLNSGVLLMDMRAVRRTGLLRRCRELCASKRMFMPDQSALNKLARSKRILPRRFNEQGDLRPDTVLQHFSTRLTPRGVQTVKPWEVERVHAVRGLHAYDDVLERYLGLKGELIV